MKVRRVDQIIIHCSASRPGSGHDIEDIDAWHRAKGWNGCGYHLVIPENGMIQQGRQLDADPLPGWQPQQGAHAAGHNSNTVSVCVIGGVDHNGNPTDDYFTSQQWIALGIAVEFLTRAFPGAEVLGHRDLPGVAKACPSFDARSWWKRHARNVEFGKAYAK